MLLRMAPTCEWDTAAADIIVREAGGAVLQAGLCDNNGKALEDWKVGGWVWSALVARSGCAIAASEGVPA